MAASVKCSRRNGLFDWLIFPATCLVLAVVCLFFVDIRVSRFFSSVHVPRELEKFIDATEHFGTTYGQLLVLLAIFAASGWQERRVFRIFFGAAAAGLTANVVKLFVGRTRPRAFDFDQCEVFDGFVRWLPFGQGGSAIQSFPSAHTATAFGFAAMLAWTYPRGRAVFILLGLFVGIQRISTMAHFPSDVLVGAAVGWWVGMSFTGNSWIAKKFQRLECSLKVASDTFDEEVHRGMTVEHR